MTTLYYIAIERESKLLSSAASVFIVMKIITTTKRMKRKPSCCDIIPISIWDMHIIDISYLH